ncbi:MAG: hypothetical protein KC736_00455 [Candidatus Moranbacteria bacterium]|nr:hypothetical protein [Candidatus Moranbacteria bacterium]
MKDDQKRQFEQFIEKSADLLIILPENPSGDAISAGMAMANFLENKQRNVVVAFADPFNKKERFTFLPQPKEIKESLSGSRDFVLSFNTTRNKIIRARTEQEGETYRIYITPQNGTIDPRDFSFIPASFPFDLVITIGSKDKESTGLIYEENPDIFYEIPTINIDNNPANEQFGQINFVDVTACGTSEIVAELLGAEDEQKTINKEQAQCLLSGIITATESFQKTNTTPKSLRLAGNLMDKGADQQEIIQHLYKTQPFNILKLWGRVMAHLKWDEQRKLMWGMIRLEDFIESRTKPTDLAEILEKIKTNHAAGEYFIILYQEAPQNIKGIADVPNEQKRTVFAQSWNTTQKGSLLEFTSESGSMDGAEAELLAHIK